MSADLLRSTDLIGSMETYTKITINKQSQATAICRAMHKKPEWNEALCFDISKGQLCNMAIEVLDKDKYSRDDIVGSTEYNFWNILNEQH